jgi:(p)ppGpp synthase/HD superfamily hydrolase
VGLGFGYTRTCNRIRDWGYRVSRQCGKDLFQQNGKTLDEGLNMDWEAVENRVRDIFGNRVSKSGTPMVNHSLDVGRRLRADGRDTVTVFGGYFHDAWEDTQAELPGLLELFMEFLPPLDAVEVVTLVAKCSYQPDEYRLPKPERKKAAIARWIDDEDIRISHIKIADVDSNDTTADSVPIEGFAENYRSWAYPLRETLREKWNF